MTWEKSAWARQGMRASPLTVPRSLLAQCPHPQGLSTAGRAGHSSVAISSPKRSKQQVQGPTWEPGQEQKETGPNASNNRGPKSFLETGPKASLKTSAPATKLKGLSLSLNSLLGHGWECGVGSWWASRPLRLIIGNLSLRFCKAFNNSYLSICKIHVVIFLR